jgi:hypothetical protein
MKTTYIKLAASASLGGILLLISRFIFAPLSYDTLSGIGYGFGVAILVIILGKWIDTILVRKTESEETARKKEIEVNDERNTRIRERVGAKTNRIVFYAVNALIFIFGIMGVDLIVILALAAIDVVELISVIVLANYYSKSM